MPDWSFQQSLSHSWFHMKTHWEVKSPPFQWKAAALSIGTYGIWWSSPHRTGNPLLKRQRAKIRAQFQFSCPQHHHWCPQSHQCHIPCGKSWTQLFLKLLQYLTSIWRHLGSESHRWQTPTAAGADHCLSGAAAQHLRHPHWVELLPELLNFLWAQFQLFYKSLPLLKETEDL